MEPRPIAFKEWRDTRTFSNLKSTHCTLLILLIINLVTKKSLCIVSKVQIRVITKLPNSEQSYIGKVKTHKYINRQNQSTTGKL
jgi:hypothetical protein